MSQTQNNKCPQCGAGIDPGARDCRYCGEALPLAQPTAQRQQEVVVVQQNTAQPSSPCDSSWPVRNKTVAGLLAIFLGFLGIHKFYLGNMVMGILYIAICIFIKPWIPGIIGIVEGIIYFTSSDHDFQIKYRVRLQ